MQVLQLAFVSLLTCSTRHPTNLPRTRASYRQRLQRMVIHPLSSRASGQNLIESSQWHIDDSTISGRHLKIYSINYEDDNGDIDPLVYATDLSRNGTTWNGTLIGRGQSVLLSDCDTLALGSRFEIIYKVKDVLFATEEDFVRTEDEVCIGFRSTSAILMER